MKTQEIKEVVKKLKPAFKANDLAEFGQYVYFLKNKIMAYNGNVCIVIPTENDVEVALPIEEFEKFINRISAKEIDMVVGENVELKAGRAKATFAKNDEILDSAKKLNINIPTDFEELPEDFIAGIKLVQYSVSKDMGREDQTFVKVEDNTLVSTDNFRVSEVTMSSDLPKMFIAGGVLKYLISYNVTSYSIDEGVIYFKTKDDMYFMTRLGNVNFVEYEHLFDVNGDKFTFPKDMDKLIDTASVTVDGISDIDKMVKVVIDNNVIKLSSKNDIGMVEVEEELENNSVTASFFINPEFMMDVLKVTNEAIITDNLILFNTDNFRQLIALFEG